MRRRHLLGEAGGAANIGEQKRHLCLAACLLLREKIVAGIAEPGVDRRGGFVIDHAREPAAEAAERHITLLAAWIRWQPLVPVAELVELRILSY
jgi:hypothetical protein